MVQCKIDKIECLKEKTNKKVLYGDTRSNKQCLAMKLLGNVSTQTVSFLHLLIFYIIKHLNSYTAIAPSGVEKLPVILSE